MGFRDAMERKMKIISPTRRDLAALGEKILLEPDTRSRRYCQASP